LQKRKATLKELQEMEADGIPTDHSICTATWATADLHKSAFNAYLARAKAQQDELLAPRVVLLDARDEGSFLLVTRTTALLILQSSMSISHCHSERPQPSTSATAVPRFARQMMMVRRRNNLLQGKVLPNSAHQI
jgi:hypothetical protein